MTEARATNPERWSSLVSTGWATDYRPPDLDSCDATERIRRVASSDLAVLPIPADFGGLGADLLATAAAQRVLAMGDASTAIALNMHVLSVGLMVEHWRRRRDVSWMLLEALGETHNLVASAFAEPGGSSNLMRSGTIARRTDTGYVLTGTKFPCSLATTAQLFCVSAQVADEDATIVALCPRELPGLIVTPGWKSLGMRQSDTGRVEFRAVELDQRLVFHEGPVGMIDDIVIGGLVWFSVLVAATYHGVLTKLLMVAAAQPPRGSVHSCSAQLRLAAQHLIGLGAECRQLASVWGDSCPNSGQAAALACALRLRMSACVDAVVSALRPVIGSPAYLADTEPALLVLDALAVHHHPPSVLQCEAVIEQVGSGKRLSLDPVP